MGSAVLIREYRIDEGDEEERIGPPRGGDRVGTTSRETIGSSVMVNLRLGGIHA